MILILYTRQIVTLFVYARQTLTLVFFFYAGQIVALFVSVLHIFVIKALSAYHKLATDLDTANRDPKKHYSELGTNIGFCYTLSHEQTTPKIIHSILASVDKRFVQSLVQTGCLGFFLV